MIILRKKEYMIVYEYQLALMGIAVKDKMYIHVFKQNFIIYMYSHTVTSSQKTNWVAQKNPAFSSLHICLISKNRPNS